MRHRSIVPTAAFGFAVGLSAILHAASLTLHNTGEGLAQGDADPHWSVTLPDGTAFGSAISATDPSGNWVAPAPPNTWISIVAAGGVAPGVYQYTTTFTIGAGLDPATAEVSGHWWADEPNDPNAIFLNGVQVSDFNGAVWFDTDPANAAFSITSGFSAGLNTLTFYVENTGGPGGTLIENLAGRATVIPEVSALVPVGLFCLAFGGLRRWSRRQAER